MKAKLFIPALAGAIFSTLGSSAIAAPPTSELLGQRAPVSVADYAVVIGPDTKYVNVDLEDTVQFNVGGKTFAWDFDVADTVGALNLSQIAPQGMLDHPVSVYVSPFRKDFGRENDS